MKRILSTILGLCLIRPAFKCWNTVVTGFGFATNEMAWDGEWLKITPWGDFDNRVGMQRITKDDGNAMVTAFNSLRSRLTRAFMGLPVFVGHPDMDPAGYADKRRYGRINELKVREDGLYGLVSLNDLGKQAISEGHYLFASPAWNLRRDGRTVRPTELISVGLTNTPQIPGDPWAKNETEGTNMPQWLKDILISASLLKADDTEDTAKTAVNELVTRANRVTELQTQIATANAQRDTARTELATASNERDTFKQQSATERQARIDSELEAAVTSGRITQADRPGWNEKFKADFDGTRTAINEVKPQVSTQSRVGDIGTRKPEVGTGTEKIRAINEAVRKFAHEQGLDIATNQGHREAYDGVKRQQPALFQ